MPLVTFYFRDSQYLNQFQVLSSDFKKFLAEKLTCNSITLSPSEISLRSLVLSGGEMIGNIECEITAHGFSERIEKKDEICLEVVKYLQEKTGISNVKVWLKLMELGHSW